MFAAASRLGLEGIVSKRTNCPIGLAANVTGSRQRTPIALRFAACGAREVVTDRRLREALRRQHRATQKTLLLSLPRWVRGRSLAWTAVS